MPVFRCQRSHDFEGLYVKKIETQGDYLLVSVETQIHIFDKNLEALSTIECPHSDFCGVDPFNVLVFASDWLAYYRWAPNWEVDAQMDFGPAAKRYGEFGQMASLGDWAVLSFEGTLVVHDFRKQVSTDFCFHASRINQIKCLDNFVLSAGDDTFCCSDVSNLQFGQDEETGNGVDLLFVINAGTPLADFEIHPQFLMLVTMTHEVSRWSLEEVGIRLRSVPDLRRDPLLKSVQANELPPEDYGRAYVVSGCRAHAGGIRFMTSNVSGSRLILHELNLERDHTHLVELEGLDFEGPEQLIRCWASFDRSIITGDESGQLSMWAAAVPN